MSKKIIILAILSAFLLAGYSNLFKKSANPEKEKVQKEGKGFSLKNALSLGKSIKCTIETDWGESTTWVKGEKVRSEGTGFGAQEDKGGMINDGQWIYIWSEENPEKGMKYKLSVIKEGPEPYEKDMPSLKGFSNVKEWMEEMDQKYKVDCKQTIIDDNKFVPPSNIQFKDLTESFEKMQEFSESFDENAPEPLSEDKMEELQEMMKSFQVGQ